MQTTGSIESEAGRLYQQRLLQVRGEFDAGRSGTQTTSARSSAMDDLIGALWGAEIANSPRLAEGVSILATGGYGRAQLFPYSDADLLFLLDSKTQETEIKEAIRRLNQQMWDLGIRVSPATRRLSECERFDPENAEFALALLDHRYLAGDAALSRRFESETIPRMLQKDAKAIRASLLELAQSRHAKYGQTLFHLEPNVKECPGGLRDVHVCDWLEKLNGATIAGDGRPESPEAGAARAVEDLEFREAAEFLTVVRCFLHYQHERDDNTLDWHMQDRAAEMSIGLPLSGRTVDPAYWMRVYFRQARSVERRVSQRMSEIPAVRSPFRVRGLRLRKGAESARAEGYSLENGRIRLLQRAGAGLDPAEDPDVVLEIFGEMARGGWKLDSSAEARLSQGLPALSSHMEEGPLFWHRLRKILLAGNAGDALRSMHALGVLDLMIPEFHGIDSLVIRDAYHRYTVDEHTFVLIDTLHGLDTQQIGRLAPWAARFGTLLKDLSHPELLYLAALLHDTGKARNTGLHTIESARIAESVLARMELEPYECSVVVSLIGNHLEMSAALRRDIFDAETVRTLAGKTLTPEALRMLTLFTYADLNAVHPDALTPWKAENLWHLYIATANYLDRSLDEERVGRQETKLVDRVAATLPHEREGIEAYLEGFPERYVRTRTPEQIRAHYLMTARLRESPVQLQFRYGPDVSELTLVTPDRPLLFANMTGVLAAWGMNIVTADAFSNAHDIVVDTFRFTDIFRTLEMNASEHERFLESVRDVLTGVASIEKLLAGRRRGTRPVPKMAVDSTVSFNDAASSHSTLVEVTAQDTPGLLRALSLALVSHDCEIEVALVDTEGETAIDVFYITHRGAKLDQSERDRLRRALIEAVEANARF